ncbi:hypothetical protein EDF51_11037 [Curtobacterium sp. PhB25]|nr:hypothetical protein EDF51_11037 [Curtobacterium sp. PhB25]
MVRRHPHVFGDETADTVDDVVRVWRAARAAEKSARTSALDGVPRAMPPLERAVKLLERLEEHGAADTAVASVVAAAPAESVASAASAAFGSVADREARGASATSTAAPGTGTARALAGSPAPADGAGAVDPAWGIAMLEEVAGAVRDGIDPVASLRVAVAALEEAGRAAE